MMIAAWLVLAAGRYTSILHADTTPLFFAEEHSDTELALRGSGRAARPAAQRLVHEVYSWRLPLASGRGELIGAAGNEQVSSAARTDDALAAATVLADDGHAGRIYELAGDASFTMDDLAAVVTAAGESMICRDMAPDAFHAAPLDAGTPAMMARILADTDTDADADIACGALFDDSGILSRLIGRPTPPYERTIDDFVQLYRADRAATR